MQTTGGAAESPKKEWEFWQSGFAAYGTIKVFGKLNRVTLVYAWGRESRSVCIVILTNKYY